MKKLIKRILSILFGKDKFYRLDYVIDNYTNITLETICNLSIDTVMDNRNVSMDIFKMLENLKEINRIIDEEVGVVIPNSMACIRANKNITYLYSMLLIDNKTTIIANFNSIIKELLLEYKKGIEITEQMRKDDLSAIHNSKVFNLYIITMEDIVNKLYWSISKRE